MIHGQDLNMFSKVVSSDVMQTRVMRPARSHERFSLIGSFVKSVFDGHLTVSSPKSLLACKALICGPRVPDTDG